MIEARHTLPKDEERQFPITVSVVNIGTITVHRQGPIFSWHVRLNTGEEDESFAGSAILALVMAGMAIHALHKTGQKLD
jgi:hypothetical protein